eukprot:scaffold1158_cov27-Tisochrysis_lutea.AAC.4
MAAGADREHEPGTIITVAARARRQVASAHPVFENLHALLIVYLMGLAMAVAMLRPMKLSAE